MYVKRVIENRIVSSAKQFPAVAVTGPRQSGKTTMLKHIFAASHEFVSFDDPIIRERAISDPKLFLSETGKRMVIDEIQYVPELLSYIKMEIDNNRQAKGRFILTGSQQYNLMKNLGDSLAGRVALFKLFPFCAEEMESVKSLKKTAANPLSAFVNACMRGCFPEPVVSKKIDIGEWYSSYLSTYIERDVRSLYNVGMIREFQRFIRLLASKCGQQLNMNSMASDIGVAVNTIKSWISILEAGNITYLLYPYYQAFGKRVTKTPKVYFTDSAMVCYLTGIRDREHLIHGPMAGQLFENYCIQEVLKILVNRTPMPNIYYLRTKDGIEIDLIIESGMDLTPVEIKFTKTPSFRMAESIGKVRALLPKLNFLPGRVVSISEESLHLAKDVMTMSIVKFLRSV